MKRYAALRSMIVTATVVALSSSAVMADTKIVQAVHTGEVMGKSAQDSTTTLWLGADRMRTDSGDSSTIVRLDQKKIYIMNHSDRTFSVINYPVDLSSMFPPEMAQMMEAMNVKMTVTPSDETKEILGHNTRRYDVVMKSSMMEMKQKIWAAKDVDFDFASARDMANVMQSLQPGMADAIKEMTKIEGFQLEMDGSMKVMGKEIGTSSKTLSIDETSGPDGGYDPPAGYQEKPFNPMQQKR